MDNTKRVLTALALAGSLFGLAVPAHADDHGDSTATGHSATSEDVSIETIGVEEDEQPAPEIPALGTIAKADSALEDTEDFSDFVPDVKTNS
ncbi:hypothetical protein ACWFQ8_06930 [Streptomyces sp. NPDC055254]